MTAEAFETWLRDNYQRVVEKLKHPSPKPVRREPDRDEAGREIEF